MTGGDRDDEDDDDRTRFAPLPGGPGGGGAPGGAAGGGPAGEDEDDDRTAFQPMPGGPPGARWQDAEDDDDRTAFAPAPGDTALPSAPPDPGSIQAGSGWTDPAHGTRPPADATGRHPSHPPESPPAGWSEAPPAGWSDAPPTAGPSHGPGMGAGASGPDHAGPDHAGPDHAGPETHTGTAQSRTDRFRTHRPPQAPPAHDLSLHPPGPEHGGTGGTGGAFPGSRTGQDGASREPGAPMRPPGLPGRGDGRSGKLDVGTVINNNYRIDEVLKAGGMGEVYRGSEIHTGDPVAIKAILPEKADSESAGLLFKREARTLRQLVDETIVRYYNYVHDPGLDRYFLVMEFIEGVQLKDHVAQNGALPLADVQVLLTRLATGLAKAHAQGVVHRDLSPDNVMLPGGHVREARIIDFGIAKSNVVTEGTMAGMFAGKFKYVAPEQFGHFGGRISEATDIYGLALLIAAAAAGRPLDMGNTMVESVQRRQSIPDLSTVPRELRPILSYMLEPDPADRPASMQVVGRLAEHPEDIPDQYFHDWVPPAKLAARTMSTGVGIQAPHMTASTATGSLPAGSQGPVPIRQEPESERSGAGKWLALLGLLFVGILGGAVWYSGILPLQGPSAADASSGTDTADPGIPPADPDLREGFLASVDTGACTHLSRVATGPLAGVIEGYSTSGATFAGVSVDYERRFGARPEIIPRAVTGAQCAVLDFVTALQGRGRDGAVQLGLSTDRMVSERQLVSTLAVPTDRSLWVVLIGAGGAWADLTEAVSRPVGPERSVAFALRAPDGAAPSPRLVLAVETDTPLAELAVPRETTAIGPVLDAILDEIRARDGAASADLAFFELVGQ